MAGAGVIVHPSVPAQAGTQVFRMGVSRVSLDSRFRLRALRFDGLEPAEARTAGEGWVRGNERREG
jgi:hypothetical protein